MAGFGAGEDQRWSRVIPGGMFISEVEEPVPGRGWAGSLVGTPRRGMVDRRTATLMYAGRDRRSTTRRKVPLTIGSLLTTATGRGAAVVRHGRCQAAIAAGRAGAPATTPATSARARPTGSASLVPGAASPARTPPRRACSRWWLVVSPRVAPGGAVAGSAGAGCAGCSANQARQQNEKRNGQILWIAGPGMITRRPRGSPRLAPPWIARPACPSRIWPRRAPARPGAAR